MFLLTVLLTILRFVRGVNKDFKDKVQKFSSRTEIKDFRLSRHLSCNAH